ncbi:MAG TPA: M13 family metallopeptidase [Usitatibacter sp.]|nr:M13 family metallopeptidase [Usitatibacter sp.]
MQASVRAAALALALASSAHAALDVRELDGKADPCRDFYGYVNGSWLAATTIPDDRSGWGTFAIVAKRNEAILLAALDEALAAPPAEGSAARKAVDFYASGMDIDAIEKAGLDPVSKPLAAADSVTDARSLAVALAALHARRIRAGFEFGVRADAKDSGRYLAQLLQGGLGLPERDYYFRTDERSKTQRADYVAHVARLFVLAGDSRPRAEERANTVLALETQLANASLGAVERRDPEKTYHKMTMAQLEELAPGFPWHAYLEALGTPALSEANVAQPEFFRAFARLAKERAPAEWRTYLRWHVLHAAARTLPRAFADADFDFYQRELRGRRSQPLRAGEVVDFIVGHYGEQPMAEAMGQIFVARAFSTQAKARALELVRNVKEALAGRLRAVEWMSEATRERALEKLAAMNVKIGYPDRWRDYSAATVGAHVYAENWLRANEFEHRRLVAKLAQPVDRGEWWMAPYIVNAYYSAERNEIVFPAGILQPPFFDAEADDALNYGAIGAVIGHEITHGFDDRGRRYDAQGNLRDWWTQTDARGYLARAKRIEEQYAGYEGIEGLHVNGQLTLGENISDVGGLKIAYLALAQALDGREAAPIDGLTPEQRFFISFAQAWRATYRPAYERLLIQTDQHSPARFRVRGALAHMPEFAKAFHCEAPQSLAGEPAEIW